MYGYKYKIMPFKFSVLQYK